VALALKINLNILAAPKSFLKFFGRGHAFYGAKIYKFGHFLKLIKENKVAFHKFYYNCV